MLVYVAGGAVVGALIGYLVPPGALFWFIVGAISGWLTRCHVSRR